MRLKVHFSQTMERSTEMIIEAEDPSELNDEGVRKALEDAVAEWPDDYWSDDHGWGPCFDRVEKVEAEPGEAVHYLIRGGDGYIEVTEDEDEYREAMGLDEDDPGPPLPLPGQMGLEGIGQDIPADEEVTSG